MDLTGNSRYDIKVNCGGNDKSEEQNVRIGSCPLLFAISVRSRHVEQPMRNWGSHPSTQEIEIVSATLRAFRERWASTQPPFPAEFDGTIADVHALDYIDYEGIGFPHAEIEGAAMVCGEVIRRAACLEWVISARGDWFVASRAEDWPTIAICPLARLHEIKCSGVPQFGKHFWLVQKAAFECLLFCAPEREPMIRELLGGPGDYLEHMAKTLEALRRSSRS